MQPSPHHCVGLQTQARTSTGAGRRESAQFAVRGVPDFWCAMFSSSPARSQYSFVVVRGQIWGGGVRLRGHFLNSCLILGILDVHRLEDIDPSENKMGHSSRRTNNPEGCLACVPPRAKLLGGTGRGRGGGGSSTGGARRPTLPIDTLRPVNQPFPNSSPVPLRLPSCSNLWLAQLQQLVSVLCRRGAQTLPCPPPLDQRTRVHRAAEG